MLWGGAGDTPLASGPLFGVGRRGYGESYPDQRDEGLSSAVSSFSPPGRRQSCGVSPSALHPGRLTTRLLVRDRVAAYPLGVAPTICACSAVRPARSCSDNAPDVFNPHAGVKTGGSKRGRARPRAASGAESG